MTEKEAEKLLALVVELEEDAKNVGLEDSRGGDKQCDAYLEESRNALNNYILSLLK